MSTNFLDTEKVRSNFIEGLRAVKQKTFTIKLNSFPNITPFMFLKQK